MKLSQILEQLKQDTGHRTCFDTSWTQGYTAYGGLSAALAASGMEKLLPAPLPMRSLMVSFVAPLPPGEVVVEPKIVRQGKNVSQLSANLIVDGKIVLQAMGVYGKSRSTLSVTPDPHFNPEPRSEENPLKERAGKFPPFLNHFEGAWTGGGMPFTGTKDLRLGIWVKHTEDLSRFPNEKIVSIADLPPPVVLSHYNEPTVNSSSVTWSLEFVTEPESIETDWFYLDFEVDNAANGYSQQSGKIFTEDGRLCALSRQCMAYFEQT